jgi:glutamate decarboxylase
VGFEIVQCAADVFREGGSEVAGDSVADENALDHEILIRNGVSRDLISILLGDFKRAFAYFGKYPVSSPLTAKEATGYRR